MSKIEKIQEEVMKVFSRFQRSGMDARNYPFYIYLLLLKKDSVYSKVNEAGIADLKDSLKLIIDEQYKNAPAFEKYLHHYFTSQYWSKIENLHLKLVIDELNTIDQIDFCQNFEAIVEGIIEQFSGLRPLNSFEYSQPKEIISLIRSLASLQEGSSVYNPFAGLADFNEAFQNSYYYGQEMNPEVWCLGALRLLAKKNPQNKIIENMSPLAPQIEWNTNNIQFDLIVSMVPYTIINGNNDEKGINKNNTHEIFLIEEGLKILKPKGKIILVAPNRFLHQQGPTEKLRRRIVQDDILETVISLPPGLLNSTNISLTLLLIDLNKPLKEQVMFVDGRSCYIAKGNREIALDTPRLLQIITGENEQHLTKRVHQNVIDYYDYNIEPLFYLRKKFEGAKLSDFASIILAKKIFLEPGEPFVRSRNLKNSTLEFNLDLNEIGSADTRIKAQVIEESCLLIALRHYSIKPTFFEYTGKPIHISNDIVALKIDLKKVSIGYLIHQLHSYEVEEQLEYIKYGEHHRPLNKNELLNLIVHLPNYEIQTASLPAIRKSLEESKIKETGLQVVIDRILLDQKDDLSIKKHNIMQYLSNVKDAALLLVELMHQNNGVLKGDAITSPNKGKTVNKTFESLIRSLDDALHFTNALTNEIDFQQKEELNIIQLLEEAIYRGKDGNNLFEIDFIPNIEQFTIYMSDTHEKEKIEPVCKVSRLDFFEMYNNILENSVKHGFIDKSEKYIFQIKVTLNITNGCMDIIFQNNGKPFSEGMADRYCIKNEKAGKYSGEGIGSWKVCEIVKYFGGTLKIVDDKKSFFPVQIHVSLPIIGFN